MQFYRADVQLLYRAQQLFPYFSMQFFIL